MAADTTVPRSKRESFRRWRRSRPFWGGLLLMLAGIELFLSGNLDLGSVQIHLGMTGYLSYVLPLILVLCGALIWVSPAQRMFYGIIGNLSALYSVTAVNFGGFLIGMLIGIIGGALATAWVPDKYAVREAASVDDDTADYGVDGVMNSEDTAHDGWSDDHDAQDHDDPGGATSAGAASGPLRDTLPTATRSPLASPSGSDGDGTAEKEGKKHGRFPRPRHAAEERNTTDDATRWLSPSLLLRRSPRTIAIALTALTIAVIGLAALPGSTPAVAADCPPTALTKLIDKAAHHKAASGKAAAGKTRTGGAGVTDRSAGRVSGYGSVGFAAAPVVPADSSAPPDPTPSTSTSVTPEPSSPAPPSSPVPSSPAPSAGPSSPAPSASPTTGPSGTPKPKPKPKPKPTPPEPSPTGNCTVISKFLAAASGQPYVNENPSTQTAGTLSMSGLTYDGIVDLPTKTGTIKVLQFSMDSSTSTPFELRPSVGGHAISIKCSSLTVSGHVKFYTTEIKGSLLGVLPVDFTVASPPQSVIPELFFTDATVSLVYVQSDTLTAGSLSITMA